MVAWSHFAKFLALRTWAMTSSSPRGCAVSECRSPLTSLWVVSLCAFLGWQLARCVELCVLLPVCLQEVPPSVALPGGINGPSVRVCAVP